MAKNFMIGFFLGLAFFVWLTRPIDFPRETERAMGWLRYFLELRSPSTGELYSRPGHERPSDQSPKIKIRRK